jgi:uncharacterized protein (DUF488 family)
MQIPTVLTIGHSTHPLERFIELLEKFGVTAVADVRSKPYSRHIPEFNREALEHVLRGNEVAYVFLGRELGARSKDPTVYREGRVQYRKLAQTNLFKTGLQRVINGAQSHRITLLCAEKDPLSCHRTLLVARELDALGIPVAHIHADGALEPHAEAMDRLLRLVGMPTADLFLTKEELIAQACDIQGRRIAYVDDDLLVEPTRLLE